jgi:hypothetical protein
MLNTEVHAARHPAKNVATDDGVGGSIGVAGGMAMYF